MHITTFPNLDNIILLPKKLEADTIKTKRDPRTERFFGFALAVFLGILTFIATTIGIHSGIPLGWLMVLAILGVVGFIFLMIAWIGRK